MQAENHEGTHYPNGMWKVQFRAGDEEHTYIIPFEMRMNDYYMCYVWDRGFLYEGDIWANARIIVLQYQDLTDINGETQPLYRAVEGEPSPPLGRGLVLPFKQLGCQWPPHPGEESWT
jgi:hypothetical protein